MSSRTAASCMAATWIAPASAFIAKHDSGARNRRKVPLLQDLPVMQLVPDHNER